MSINPYEQYPFHGKIAGRGGDKDPGSLRPNVIPPEDDPLSTPMQIGYWLLHRGTFPDEGYMNAFFVYYLSRVRRSGLDAVVGLLPWLLLLAAEAAFILAKTGIGILEEWLLLLVVEILFLPIMVALPLMLLLMYRIRMLFQRVNLEELSATPISGADIVYSLAARMNMIFALGLLLETLALMALIVESVFVRHAVRGPEGLLAFVLFLFLLIRYYLMRSAVTHATACALRATLLIRDPGKAQLRALRDFLLIGSGVALLSICAVLVVLVFQYLIFVLSCGMLLLPLILLFIGSVLEEQAAKTLLWLAQNKSHWAFIREGDSSLVPSTLGERWDMTVRKPVPVHPVLRR